MIHSDASSVDTLALMAGPKGDDLTDASEDRQVETLVESLEGRDDNVVLSPPESTVVFSDTKSMNHTTSWGVHGRRMDRVSIFLLPPVVKSFACQGRRA